MAGSSEGDLHLNAVRRSLKCIVFAIDLLDAHGGPPEATAHLELARQMLRDHLTSESLGGK